MTLALVLATMMAPGWPTEEFQDLSSSDSRLVMRDLAHCMVGSSTQRASQIVNAGPADPRAWAFSVRPDCLPASMTSPMQAIFGGGGLSLRARPIHYRYAFAEALLLKEYRNHPPAIAATSPALSHLALSSADPVPTNWPGDRAQWAKYVQGTREDARVSAFGECVVRASPDQSWALLRTEVASTAESQAFNRLTPALAGCVKALGFMPRGKFNVRGTIALNLFRLTHTAAVAPLASVKR